MPDHGTRIAAPDLARPGLPPVPRRGAGRVRRTPSAATRPISPSSARFLRTGDGGRARHDVDARASAPTSRRCTARGLAARSIARKLAAVRSCFRFLVRRGVLPANPARAGARAAPAAGGCRRSCPRTSRRICSTREPSRPATRAGATGRSSSCSTPPGCAWRSAGLDIDGRRPPRADRPRARQGRTRAHGARWATRPWPPSTHCLGRRAAHAAGPLFTQPTRRSGSTHAERAPIVRPRGARGRHRPARDARTPCATPSPPTCSARGPTCA